MKSACTILICILSLGMAYANDPIRASEKKSDSLEDLANRLLKVMQNDNFDGLKNVWTSYEQMKPAWVKAIEAGKAPKSTLRKAKPYIDKRDAIIAKRLPALIKALKENGYDVNKLSLLKASGKIRQEIGLPFAPWVHLEFKYDDDSIVKLLMDDAYKIDGTWYFGDTPDDHWEIIKGGKTTKLAAKENK